MRYWRLLLAKLLQVSYSETQLDKRGFSYDNIVIKKHLEKIGEAFLGGYHTALNTDSGDKLLHELDQYSDLSRGFAFEGAAMACALTDALSPFSNNSRFQDLLNSAEGQKHIYMLHIGLGWALARLPGRIETKIEAYDSMLKWLVIDGVGFHQAYFHTDKYVRGFKLPGMGRHALHIFFQGVGRCLWFVEGADPGRIEERIKSFSEDYAGDLWSGVGLASAYAGGVSKEVIMQVKKCSDKYILNLAQGCAFAAKARIRAGNLAPHTSMACMIYTGVDAIKASEITDDCLSAIPKSEVGLSGAYDLWRSNISRQFDDLIYDNVSPAI